METKYICTLDNAKAKETRLDIHIAYCKVMRNGRIIYLQVNVTVAAKGGLPIGNQLLIYMAYHKDADKGMSIAPSKFQ